MAAKDPTYLNSTSSTSAAPTAAFTTAAASLISTGFPSAPSADFSRVFNAFSAMPRASGSLNREHRSWILNHLTHIVNNQATCTHQFLAFVFQASRQNRKHHCKRWRLYILHEDASSKLVHTLVGIVD